MHNYWLKRKDLAVKSVNWNIEKGKSEVIVELVCGRRYRCYADAKGVLTVYNLSYVDPKFYTLIDGDVLSLEPWDENIFSARYDVVDKVALSILLRTGELKFEDYQDSYDYYDNVKVTLLGSNWGILPSKEECGSQKMFIQAKT